MFTTPAGISINTALPKLDLWLPAGCRFDLTAREVTVLQVAQCLLHKS